MLERKVYNNDDITFFFVYLRVAMSWCNNVLQPSPLRNTFTHSGSANVNTRKRMFYPLINSTILYSDFLAHLSRRLIGELIVYKGIRRPSSVRLSTFSNDISSETVRPILSILHT